MNKKPELLTIINRIGRYAVVLMTAALVLAAIGLLLAVVPVFGNKALIVRSGSMAPAIGVGDLVVVRGGKNEYERGQVIAFAGERDSSVVVTHRIAEVIRDGDKVSYVTKGDANDQPDETVVARDRVLGARILTVPYVGRVLALGKTKAGLVAFIIIPAFLIIMGDVMVIVREVRSGCRASSTPGVFPLTPGVFPARRASAVYRPVVGKMFVDGVVAKVVLLVFSIGLTIPSGLALYSDSEVSVDNVFAAADDFEDDSVEDEDEILGGQI